MKSGGKFTVSPLCRDRGHCLINQGSAVECTQPSKQASMRFPLTRAHAVRCAALLVVLAVAAGAAALLHAAVRPPKLQYQMFALPDRRPVILSADYSTPVVIVSMRAP